MFKFVELKEVQQRYICAVINKCGHTEPEIALNEMKQYHESLIEMRSDGTKYGYPNWLIKPKNKISMGVYGFPIPTTSEIEDLNSGKSQQVINIEDYSPLFKQTVKEYNLL
jgi:hypothetical protein